MMEHTKVILVVILLSLVVVSAGCLHGTDTSPQNQTNVTDDETNQPSLEDYSDEMLTWLNSGNYSYTLKLGFVVRNQSTHEKISHSGISSRGVRNSTGEFVQTKEFEFENGSRQLVSEYRMRATDDYIEITVDNETERIKQFDNGTPTPGTTYNVSVGNRTQWTYNTFRDEALEIIRRARQDDLGTTGTVHVFGHNIGTYVEAVTGKHLTEENFGIRVETVGGDVQFSNVNRSQILFIMNERTADVFLEGTMRLRIRGVDDDVDFSEFFRRGV